jgi:hypothetical protein
MLDPKIFTLAESLNEKANNVLKAFNINMSTNIQQADDHYAFELYTADLNHLVYVSLQGRGLREQEYYVDIMRLVQRIIDATPPKDK